jgi:hypothetical protein
MWLKLSCAELIQTVKKKSDPKKVVTTRTSSFDAALEMAGDEALEDVAGRRAGSRR